MEQSGPQVSPNNLHLYNQILDYMLEGVSLVRMSDLVIVYTSPVFDRMFGYGQGELLGQPARVVASTSLDDPAEETLTAIREGIRREGQWSGEAQQTRKDGSLIWCLVRIFPFEHAEFGPVFLSLNQDITERKHAEKELEVSQRRLLAAQSIAHLGTWEFDNDTHAGYWSPEMFDIHGWDVELGEPPFGRFLQMIYPDDLNLFESSRQRVIRERVPLSFDYRIIRPDGVIRTVNAVIDIVPNSGNHMILMGTLQDITERKRAEEKLLEERNLLMTLIDNLPDQVYVKDTNSSFVLANSASLRYLGASSLKDVIGKTDFDFAPKELAIQYYTGEQDLFRLGKPILSQEQRVYDHSTRQFRWIAASKIPLQDAQGRITRLVAMHHDITERKEIQDTLSHMAAIVEYSNDAIISKTPDNFIKTWNRGAERMYGYTAAEMIGQPFSLLVPPDKVAEITALLEKVRHGETVDYFESVRVHKDGRRFYISLALSPIMDVRGRVVSISSIARDITPLKNAQDALRRQEELYRTLVHNLPESGVILFDHDLRYILVDGSTLDKHGYEKEKMEGKTVWELQPPEKAEFLVARYRKTLAGETTQFEWSGSDGTIYFVQTVPVRDASGDIMAGLLMFQDVTERKRIEKEIVEARQRAEQANRLKSSFLATVSHELRTPLNAIIGFSDVMLKGMLGPITDLQREYAHDILSNGEHLLMLINGILDLSKIEAGQFDLSYAEVHPGDLLSHVSRRLIGLAENKGLAFTTFIDPALPKELNGDELRLKQILINLISNAIKFTEKGSIEVRFELENDTSWAMSVRDTGIGIPQEALGFLFDEFRQVDNSLERAYEGSGLGLSIVCKLAGLMHGTVDVQSEIGQGSVFTVHLPLNAEAEKGVNGGLSTDN